MREPTPTEPCPEPLDSQYPFHWVPTMVHRCFTETEQKHLYKAVSLNRLIPIPISPGTLWKIEFFFHQASDRTSVLERQGDPSEITSSQFPSRQTGNYKY